MYRWRIFRPVLYISLNIPRTILFTAVVATQIYPSRNDIDDAVAFTVSR